MPHPIVSTKNFVRHHKVAIAITSTTAICFALSRGHVIKGYDEFLVEKGLYDEFYAPKK